jgi:1-acyl-sn-glycerol-3-phosphate acyltransferase
MAVVGADRLLQRGSWIMRPGTIHIYFSPAILPNKYKGENAVEELKEKCFSRLEGMLLSHD